MRKILSVILALMLLLGITCVYAEETTETESSGVTGENTQTEEESAESAFNEEDIKAFYEFGEVSGEAKPGETISIPVYVSANVPISTVVFNIKFDNTAFEYIPYASAADKGKAGFGVIQADLTEHDDSLIGFFAMNLSATKEVELANTHLVNFRFKVLDDAEGGEKAIEIVKSTTTKTVGVESSGGFSTTLFDAEPITVNVIAEQKDSAGENNTKEEIDDDENSDESGDEETNDEADNELVDETGSDDDSSESGEGSVTVPVTPGNNEGDKPQTDKTETDKPQVEIPQTPTPEFTDLAGFEWAEEYIIPLAKAGIIRGTSETTFAPGNNITRADFMVLLMRLLELEGEAENEFEDVPSDAYFANAVANAKQLGIAKGSDGKFSPYDSITREDMCVLVYRALNTMAYLPVTPNDGDFDTKYSDVEQISDYAYDAMKELSANGIIGGSDGMVNPKGYATRAETAVIMYRIQQLIPEF